MESHSYNRGSSGELLQRTVEEVIVGTVLENCYSEEWKTSKFLREILSSARK